MQAKRQLDKDRGVRNLLIPSMYFFLQGSVDSSVFFDFPGQFVLFSEVGGCFIFNHHPIMFYEILFKSKLQDKQYHIHKFNSVFHPNMHLTPTKNSLPPTTLRTSPSKTQKKSQIYLYSWRNHIHPEVTKIFFNIFQEAQIKEKISKSRKFMRSSEHAGPQNKKQILSSSILQRSYKTENPEKIKMVESKLTLEDSSFRESKSGRLRLNLNSLSLSKETEKQKYNEQERKYLLEKFIQHINRQHGCKI